MGITISNKPNKISEEDEELLVEIQRLSSPTEVLFDSIKQGMEGDNQGIPIGMPKVESLTSGLTRNTYTVIFGPSGSGKTTFALYSHVFRPLYDNINPKLLYVYYSLEMPAHILYAKLLSMYIFETTGTEISLKEMLSINRGFILSDKLYKVLLQGKAWLKSIEGRFIVYDKMVNAQMFEAHTRRVFEKLGKFKTVGSREIYIPKDPEIFVVGVLDHYSLISSSNSLKNEIDKISATIVRYKKMCNAAFVGISQVNRSMTNMDRRKSDHKEPERSDIKDSGNIEQDCDVMMAIYDPYREKLPNWRGYDVAELPHVLRGIIVLKNRYGNGDSAIGAGFYGRTGIWKELPKAVEIKDYTPFKSISSFDYSTEAYNDFNDSIAVMQNNESESEQKGIKLNFKMT